MTNKFDLFKLKFLQEELDTKFQGMELGEIIDKAYMLGCDEAMHDCDVADISTTMDSIDAIAVNAMSHVSASNERGANESLNEIREICKRILLLFD